MQVGACYLGKCIYIQKCVLFQTLHGPLRPAKPHQWVSRHQHRDFSSGEVTFKWEPGDVTCRVQLYRLGTLQIQETPLRERCPWSCTGLRGPQTTGLLRGTGLANFLPHQHCLESPSLSSQSNQLRAHCSVPRGWEPVPAHTPAAAEPPPPASPLCTAPPGKRSPRT